MCAPRSNDDRSDGEIASPPWVTSTWEALARTSPTTAARRATPPRSPEPSRRSRSLTCTMVRVAGSARAGPAARAMASAAAARTVAPCRHESPPRSGNLPALSRREIRRRARECTVVFGRHRMDSRLRGNDDSGVDSVIPAEAGVTVRTAQAGTPPAVIPAKAGIHESQGDTGNFHASGRFINGSLCLREAAPVHNSAVRPGVPRHAPRGPASSAGRPELVRWPQRAGQPPGHGSCRTSCVAIAIRRRRSHRRRGCVTGERPS